MLFTAQSRKSEGTIAKSASTARRRRGKMTEAAKAAERAKIEAQRAADELREIQRQSDRGKPQGGQRGNSHVARGMGRNRSQTAHHVFEKKLALGPIAFRPAQPARRQSPGHSPHHCRSRGCCWRQSRRHAFGASHREPRHPETFHNLARRQKPALAPPRSDACSTDEDHTTIINSLRKIRKPHGQKQVPAALFATLPGAQKGGQGEWPPYYNEHDPFAAALVANLIARTDCAGGR